MKPWKVWTALGVFVALCFVALGVLIAAAAKMQEQADASAKAASEKIEAAEKAKFDAMTPAQHALLARQAMASHFWSEALRQSEGLPPGAARSSLHLEILRARDKAEREDYGAEPDTTVLKYYMRDTIKKTANDPDSIEVADVFTPVHDTIKLDGQPVNCWRVRFTVRGRNAFGALVLQHGIAWAKGDECLAWRIGS
jgi:hypothetical protein